MASIATIQTAVGNKTAAVGGNCTAVLATTRPGSLIVIGVITDQTTDVVTLPTDGTNTAVKIGAGVQAGGGHLAFISLYYVKNNLQVATPTFTAGITGLRASAMIVREYGGLDITAPLDQSVYVGGTVAAISSGASPTTTTPTQLVIGFGGSDFGDNTYTLGAGYSNIITSHNANIDCAMEEKIVSAIGAQTATFTMGNASDSACAVATFLMLENQPGNRGSSLRVGDGLSVSGVAN